jgi:hypothetical protein
VFAGLTVNGTLYEVCDAETDLCTRPNTYTFGNVTSNGNTIVANFVEKRTTTLSFYTIEASVSAPGTGSISPSGTVKVKKGGSQTFTAAASTGYVFAGLTVNGTLYEVCDAETDLCTRPNTYTFSNVTSNGNTIVANFVAKAGAPGSWIITASTGTGGVISPTGEIKVVNGGSQTFSIAPLKGYRIDQVTVTENGLTTLKEICDEELNLCTPVNAYTFTNVTSSGSIRATFRRTK